MKTLSLVLIAVTLLAGCASSKSGDVYSRDQARREQTIRMRIIESVRPVTIRVISMVLMVTPSGWNVALPLPLSVALSREKRCTDRTR